MKNRIFLLTVFFPLPLFGADVPEAGLLQIESASAIVADGQSYAMTLPVDAGYYLLQVANTDVDVVADVSSNGIHLLKTGSWRYREASQKGVFLLESPASLFISVSSVETYATPGRIDLTLFRIVDPGQFGLERLQAELQATEGIGHHLDYYFNSTDNRAQAITLLESAIDIWDHLGERTEQARLYFELGLLQQGRSDFQTAQDALSRAITLFRQTDDQAGEAASRNALGLLLWRQGAVAEARRNFETALTIRRLRNEEFFAAEIENNLGLVARDTGELSVARSLLANAVTNLKGDDLLQRMLPSDPEQLVQNLTAISDAGGYLPSLVRFLNNLSLADAELGNIDSATITGSNALTIARSMQEHYLAAQYSINLAYLYNMQADYSGAIKLLQDVTTELAAPGQEYWLALAYDSIGLAYAGMGEFEAAQEYFQLALALDADSISITESLKYRTHLAQTYLNLGQAATAIREYEHILPLAESALPLTLGSSLNAYGEALYQHGDYQESLQAHMRAFDILAEVKQSQAGLALAKAGQALRTLGNTTQAEQYLRRALTIFRNISSREFEAWSLDQLALIAAEDNLTEAINLSAQAVDMLESVRADINSPLQKYSFLRNRRKIYEDYIHFLVQNEERESSWLISELTRARSLSDLLVEKNQSSRNASSATLQERSELIRSINAKATVLEAPDRPVSQAAEESIRRAIAGLEQRLQVVEGDLRAREPRGVTPETLGFIDAHDLQALLDPDTVVIKYLLADVSSYVWILTRDTLDIVKLADADTIAMVAEQTFAALTTQRTGNANDKLTTLADLVLDPIRPWLSAKRLIIIPEGALSYIPFEALPDSADPDHNPLIAGHDISYAPSASVLFQLNQLAGTRQEAASKDIAIVADPIFTLSDQRLAALAPDSAIPDTTVSSAADNYLANTMLRSDAFQRLPYSGLEASSISRLFPSERQAILLGLDATRTRIMEEEMSDYRILHFATHGVIDTRQPYLSGLVLSRFDGTLQSGPSYLRALDISYLNLHADLVVLSACETAQGLAVKGEGTLGLTRAFFQAGSKQVVSSLWKVSDRATAELMSLFYTEALVPDTTTAEALARAKNQLRQNPAWHSPFYWAGFVLQGDWKGSISK